MAKKAKSEFHFGKAFEELNKIVEQLESGQTDLNDALKQYEEGLKLIQQCKTQLADVENQVKVIKEKYATDEE